MTVKTESHKFPAMILEAIQGKGSLGAFRSLSMLEASLLDSNIHMCWAVQDINFSMYHFTHLALGGVRAVMKQNKPAQNSCRLGELGRMEK